MEAELSNQYQEIEVTGSVSVELIGCLEEIKGTMYEGNIILILGPTGAGKSAFIEAFDSKNLLHISSNRLEGFTQSISMYRLVNVKRTDNDDPIYLVDVPGFADAKISEMGIVSMLKDWIAAAGLDNVFRILYITPIDISRVPGSQQQVLRTFQALTGIRTAKSITVASTMWDLVFNERMKERAERNFKRLRDEIWKEYADNGTEILKFQNTQQSALSILDKVLQRYSLPDFQLAQIAGTKPRHIRETSFGASIQKSLGARIQNVLTEIENIQFDLCQPADAHITGLLDTQLEEAQKLLSTLRQEMTDFGPPLDSPMASHPVLRTTNPIQSTGPAPNQPNTQSHHIFKLQWSQNLKSWGRKLLRRRED